MRSGTGGDHSWHGPSNPKPLHQHSPRTRPPSVAPKQNFHYTHVVSVEKNQNFAARMS